MTKLTKPEIEKLTAEDMRDFMYGNIQSLIEGQNIPANTCFHYFMPPIPFGPELASFMSIGAEEKSLREQGLDTHDIMRAAVNFAAMVDYVPSVENAAEEGGQLVDQNTLIASGIKVTDLYKSVLGNIRVFDNKRSEEDEKKLAKLRSLLYKEKPNQDRIEDTVDEDDALLADPSDSSPVDLDDLLGESVSIGSFVTNPDLISEPTPMQLVYDALRIRYENVEKIAFKDANAVMKDDPNSGKILKGINASIAHALNRWKTQGQKVRVEAIQARIEQLSQGGMVKYVKDLRDKFEANEIEASVFTSAEDSGMGLLTENAHYTALRPNGILSSPSMLKVHISSSDLETKSKFRKKKTSGSVGVPFSFGLASANGSALNQSRERSFFSEDFEISFEIVQGIIDRPWFDLSFLNCRAYTTVDPTGKALDPIQQITLLSDGLRPPEKGLLKCLPMTAYFIRNLKVRSAALADLSTQEVKSVSGGGGFSLFGIGATANHENTTIDGSYQKGTTSGEITANGTYLVALSSVYLDKLPNPDFETFPEDEWI